MRVGNLPTVWSNAAVGVGVAAVLNPEIDLNLWRAGWPMAVGLSLIYAGGMVMNDAVDVAEDQRERPDRPIPSGVISIQAAWFGTVALMLAGLVLVTVFGPQSQNPGFAGAALILCVVLYNRLHHRPSGRFAWPLMGLCRSLAVLTALLAVLPDPDIGDPILWTAPLLVGLYTLVLTALARCEHGTGAKKIRSAVLTMIVLMPLVDATLMLILGAPPSLWIFSLCCVPLTVAMQRVASGV